MASITIRNLDDGVKERLRVRAAQHGHSMEEEARRILQQVVGGVSGPQLLTLSGTLFGPDHGVELTLPSREADRALPEFDPSGGSNGP